MQSVLELFILASLLSLVWSAHDFSNYPFKITLNDDPLYELYWNFDNDAENISFAVRVETTGWVGLGLSPNGQMPNSDVVIGWVTDDGQTMFHDRFAAGRAPPTIDEQQDWTLISGEEEGGFTILEFSRKYITCDDNDLPITVETARVIWSLGENDPPSAVLTSSDIHSEKGSRSLNLLGGLTSVPPDPDNLESYEISVNNVTIPEADTTYWCQLFRTPQHFWEQTRYITKFGPKVTEGNEAHVHHFLIYICEGVNDTHVGQAGECRNEVSSEIAACLQGTIIAAWAVGGEVFTYPDNVAYPIGGKGYPEYLLLELHYDNPHMRSGTIDNSGMTLYYTSTPREHDAGILIVGHPVSPLHIIPPNTKDFTTTTILPDTCTNAFFPDDGIHIFGNLLHTHIAGRGLTVQHIRYNSECGVYEELEPIDENLKYDFDYQQITHLPHEVTVKQGDIIQLKCYYNTEGLNSVTLGGISTRDEMCFTFLMYYPKIDLAHALSSVHEGQLRGHFKRPLGSPDNDIETFKENLDSFNWRQERIDSFQKLVDDSYQAYACVSDTGNVVANLTKLTDIDCSYIAPDQCSGSSPPSCCERIASTEATTESEGTGTAEATEETEPMVTEGAGLIKTSISLLILSLLTTIWINRLC